MALGQGVVALYHHPLLRRLPRRAQRAATVRATPPRREERHVLRPATRRDLHLRGDRDAGVDQSRASSRMARGDRVVRRPDRHGVARGDPQDFRDQHGRRHDRRDRRGAHLRRGSSGSQDVLLEVQPDGGLPPLRVRPHVADGVFAHRAESGGQAVAVPPADVRAGVGHRPEHHRKASGGIPTGEQVSGRERRRHLLRQQARDPRRHQTRGIRGKRPSRGARVGVRQDRGGVRHLVRGAEEVHLRFRKRVPPIARRIDSRRVRPRRRAGRGRGGRAEAPGDE